MTIQNTRELTQEMAQRDDALARCDEVDIKIKRKKEKYGETFLGVLEDLQQPIMLNAHKKCIFLILRDLKIFEFNTLSHLMSNKKILEALKPN